MAFNNFIKSIKGFKPELNLTDYQAAFIAQKLLNKISLKEMEIYFDGLFSIVKGEK